MNITSISPAGAVGSLGMQPETGLSNAGLTQGPGKANNPGEVARQFEAILVRQLLSESMKSLIDGPKGQQSYGYFISEALADGITKGGGMGLRSILESQLRGQGDARRAADQLKQSDPSVSQTR